MLRLFRPAEEGEVDVQDTPPQSTQPALFFGCDRGNASLVITQLVLSDAVVTSETAIETERFYSEETLQEKPADFGDVDVENNHETASPDRILQEFVGEWDLKIVTSTGTATGINRIVKIPDEPFVISRTYDLRSLDLEADADKILSVQALWFDSDEQIQAGTYADRRSHSCLHGKMDH
ncbi:MAG: hypothetical protein R3C49_26275 [Planctomycetaceae bacterium]